jgi:hypothetical protein
MAVLLVWTPAEAEQRLWVRGVLGRDGENAMEPLGIPGPLEKLRKTFGFRRNRVAAGAMDLLAGGRGSAHASR